MTPSGRLVMLLVGLFGASSSVFACSCGHVDTPLESLSVSAQVFEGQAEELEPVLGRYPNHSGKFPLHEWQFRVLRVWKGAPSPRASVIDARGNCSYVFRRGERYLIFGVPHPTVTGALETTICSATGAVREERVNDEAFGTALQIQRATVVAQESLVHQVSRVIRGIAFTGWAYLSLDFRSWSDTDSGGALAFRYLGGLACLLSVYFLARSSLTGYFKRVAGAVVLLGMVASLALLAWGFGYAIRNPYLHDLVTLGA